MMKRKRAEASFPIKLVDHAIGHELIGDLDTFLPEMSYRGWRLTLAMAPVASDWSPLTEIVHA
jgi:hypothetical protein